MKYVANLRKVISRSIRNGWLLKDPFPGFKMTKREVEKAFLMEEELQTIRDKTFAMERLEQVRDFFLFCCFTGLAYADVKKLIQTEIFIGIDGEKWVFTNRRKTETPSRIPLLPFALELIAEYRSHPVCATKDLALPVPSNQKRMLI